MPPYFSVYTVKKVLNLTQVELIQRLHEEYVFHGHTNSVSFNTFFS